MSETPDMLEPAKEPKAPRKKTKRTGGRPNKLADIPTTWEISERFSPAPRPKHINHIGLSGGKDSTRLLLWAIHESGYAPDSVYATFCDTGNENQITLDYIRYLEDKTGIGITTIRPGMDFFELARIKNRFPSAKARFCTYWLKIKPTIDYINATFRAGHTMTLHSGVRAAESNARAKLLEREFDGNFLCEVRRPILHMPIEEVWKGHERYGVKPNPLYAMGMARVGCFPCVMSKKSEIRQIAAKFPETIDKLRVKENDFPNGKYSSFFAAKTCPDRFHSRRYTNRKGREFTVATIDDIVRWSQSSKGAQILTGMNEFDFVDKLPEAEDAGRCSSSIGHCE